MSGRNRLVVGTIVIGIVGVLVAGVLVATASFRKESTDATGRNEIAANGNVQGDLYLGNPVSEARLVQTEAERLVYVRTVSSAARWRVDGLAGPYRIRTGANFTLVLPARPEPYTLADLTALSPDTFVEQSPRTYLLSENITVMAGANLTLEAPGGLTIRLASGPESFVSIVSLGGSISMAGTAQQPVTITSWDSETGAVDTKTSDGRGYVRLVGGHAALSYTRISNLGFWSGNTGGLALTGIDTMSAFDTEEENPVGTDDATIAGARVLPSTELSSLSEGAAQSQSLVSAGLDHVSLSSNAFGLFVTNADGITVKDSTISESLVDGLVLHRFVSDAKIVDTTSVDNAVDGFTVGRSSAGVSFRNVTAEGNGRNGISLDGQPLADGPNAVGTAVQTYGDNSITGSTIADNMRYGIEVSGGKDVTVADSDIVQNDVGIVVSHGADDVSITGNTFDDQVHQSVAVRDTVAGAEVTDNAITGGDTGIYVRNAVVDVTGNTIEEMSNHGISVLGEASGVSVTGNSVAGYGSIAVWEDKSTGAVVEKNDLLGWHPAPTVASIVTSVFQPLTIVWLLLGLLLVATALTHRRRPRLRGIRSPYANQVPLTSLSPGVVSRDEIGRLR